MLQVVFTNTEHTHALLPLVISPQMGNDQVFMLTIPDFPIPFGKYFGLRHPSAILKS